MSERQDTDFGFSRVSAEDKTRKVGDVFHSVAGRYDLMNDLMSAGIHRLWKKFTIELSGVREGDRVLDLAGGTGDLSMAFARRSGDSGLVVLSDINGSMLGEGRDRITNEGFMGRIHCTQVNAEAIPFPDDYFDCVSIGFGLRNVTDKARALTEMHRVIKPGGRLLVLEFSRPTTAPLRKLYDFYSFRCLPRLGELVTGDRASYQYLVESIRMHPDQDNLKDLIIDAGFARCEYFNLSGGIVALHRAFKT